MLAGEEREARKALPAAAVPRVSDENDTARHCVYGGPMSETSGLRLERYAEPRAVRLEASRGEPRPLQALGTLQASLGNHRLAVSHFERRARLPFMRPEAELAFHVALARSLFHARRQADAVAEARTALRFLEANPALAGHRALVLDQLAFDTTVDLDSEVRWLNRCFATKNSTTVIGSGLSRSAYYFEAHKRISRRRCCQRVSNSSRPRARSTSRTAKPRSLA